MAFAGCGQLIGSGPTGTSNGDQTVSDPTFRAPIEQNPAKTSVYVSHGLSQAIESAFATTVKENAAGRLQRVLREDGLWTDGL